MITLSQIIFGLFIGAWMLLMGYKLVSGEDTSDCTITSVYYIIACAVIYEVIKIIGIIH